MPKILSEMKVNIECRGCWADLTEQSRVLIMDDGAIHIEAHCEECGFDIDIGLKST